MQNTRESGPPSAFRTRHTRRGEGGGVCNTNTDSTDSTCRCSRLGYGVRIYEGLARSCSLGVHPLFRSVSALAVQSSSLPASFLSTPRARADNRGSLPVHSRTCRRLPHLLRCRCSWQGVAARV